MAPTKEGSLCITQKLGDSFDRLTWSLLWNTVILPRTMMWYWSGNCSCSRSPRSMTCEQIWLRRSIGMSTTTGLVSWPKWYEVKGLLFFFTLSLSLSVPCSDISLLLVIRTFLIAHFFLFRINRMHPIVVERHKQCEEKCKECLPLFLIWLLKDEWTQRRNKSLMYKKSHVGHADLHLASPPHSVNNNYTPLRFFTILLFRLSNNLVTVFFPFSFLFSIHLNNLFVILVDPSAHSSTNWLITSLYFDKYLDPMQQWDSWPSSFFFLSRLYYLSPHRQEMERECQNVSLLCCLRSLCILRPHKHTLTFTSLPSLQLLFNTNDGGYQQSEAQSSDCKPSTLQWVNRSTDLRNWTTAFEGFTLTIRDTYQGSIPLGTPRVEKTLRSPDRKFLVKHGDIVKNYNMVLTWGTQQFMFKDINAMRTKMVGSMYLFEYDYWLCIRV